MSSVLLGTGLPFLLARGGVDPANAGTSIQARVLWCSQCQGRRLAVERPPQVHCVWEFFAESRARLT